MLWHCRRYSKKSNDCLSEAFALDAHGREREINRIIQDLTTSSRLSQQRDLVPDRGFIVVAKATALICFI